MKHIDLFTGLAGFTLACHWADIQTEVMCEKDERCRQFLEQTWPGIPIVPDIREFDGTDWRGKFLLTAGTPCQPASRAGLQRGTEDDRWLWEEVARIISEAHPHWLLLENPPGIWDVAIDRVPFKVESRTVVRTENQDSYRGVYSRQETLFIGDFYKRLEEMGYELAPPLEIGACAINAPQIRQRVWIVGHSESSSGPTIASIRSGARTDTERGVSNLANANQGRPENGQRMRSDVPGGYKKGETRTHNGSKIEGDSQGDMAESEASDDRRSDTSENNRQVQQSGICDGKSDMADTIHRRQKGAEQQPAGYTQHNEGNWSNSLWLPCADGKLRRAPDDSFGLVDGLHRSLLAALGNSIVPQVAYEIIKVITTIEGNKI